MMLFAGIPSEPPMALLAAAAERAGADYGFVNQRDSAASTLVLSVGPEGFSGSLQLREGTVALESVTGVLLRLTDPAMLPECRNDAAALERARIFGALFQDWLQLSPARILNRVGPAAGNASKPAQARRLAELGWRVPATLVTSDPEEALAFRAEHGAVIFKSASGVRSIVTELGDADQQRLWRLRALPVQFQERVPGNDVRVHVVGDAVFVTEVESEALDYRYAGRAGQAARLRPGRLPAEIEARCIATAAALELPLCGIDLRRRPDGEFVAFEVNPAPAFSWYEESTGQPIADSIVSYLAAA
jgi:hypothetical protein